MVLQNISGFFGLHTYTHRGTDRHIHRHIHIHRHTYVHRAVIVVTWPT